MSSRKPAGDTIVHVRCFGEMMGRQTTDSLDKLEKEACGQCMGEKMM